METYTPGSLREEFLKTLKKELELYNFRISKYIYKRSENAWDIIISSVECNEHPDYRKNWRELCYLIGKCDYEKCPKRHKIGDD